MAAGEMTQLPFPAYSNVKGTVRIVRHWQPGELTLAGCDRVIAVPKFLIIEELSGPLAQHNKEPNKRGLQISMRLRSMPEVLWTQRPHPIRYAP